MIILDQRQRQDIGLARHGDMSQELQVDILRPFGPRILRAKMPMDFVNALNEQCDKILQDDNKRKELDESAELVGHVAEELRCDMNAPEMNPFGKFLGNLTRGLHDEFMKEKGTRGNDAIPQQIIIHSSWFVRSFESDYNPTHIHTNGTFSCVAYLKVPEGISEKNTRNTKEKYATEGYIDFIYGSSSIVTPGNLCCMPVVGDLFIFPSHLFHTVYPFFGEGERRSFSANISLTSEQNNGS